METDAERAKRRRAKKAKEQKVVDDLILLRDKRKLQEQVTALEAKVAEAIDALKWAWGTIHEVGDDEPMDYDDRAEALEKLREAIVSLKQEKEEEPQP